jgi:hypothetical protein
MVLDILRRVLVAVAILAFVTGMTIQATPLATMLDLTDGSKSGAGCPYMEMHHQASDTSETTPHTGINPDCVKQMGCLGTASLPTRPSDVTGPAAYRTVTYWLPSSSREGGSLKPELLPPIGM